MHLPFSAAKNVKRIERGKLTERKWKYQKVSAKSSIINLYVLRNTYKRNYTVYTQIEYIFHFSHQTYQTR